MDKEEYKRKMQEKYEQQVRENAELLKKKKEQDDLLVKINQEDKSRSEANNIAATERAVNTLSQLSAEEAAIRRAEIKAKRRSEIPIQLEKEKERQEAIKNALRQQEEDVRRQKEYDEQKKRIEEEEIARIESLIQEKKKKRLRDNK